MLNNSKRVDCGVGCFKPICMRRFASIPWFVCCYSLSGFVTSALSVYIISQITTIERQFALSSTKSGYLMACNDIGYSIFILIASYFASRVHIPRFLSLSTMLYGLSGILCSVPHFLFQPKPLDDKNDVKVMTSRFASPDMCYNRSILHSSPEQTFISNSSVIGVEKVEETNNFRSNLAMAFISIGMIVQGLAKAPRGPMLTQYIDDNCGKRETGFFMGIITSLSIFGPAIAYGLGGFFSQLYVTLEDVDLHPRDPRWIGAWWLGFLVFGSAAIFSAIPLLLFPAKIKPSTEAISRTPSTSKVTCGSICREIVGVFKAAVQVLSVLPFTLMLISVIIMTIGFNSVMTFGPKYMEVHFGVPTSMSNYAIAVFTIISVCVGSFAGGVITKKVKLTPRSSTLLILIPQIPSLALQFIAMFMACDQPQIHNWANQSSASLPEPCSTACSCDNRFLPVCDGAGTNYFSPCHAGCSGGTPYKFTNCTCIPGGEVTSGLCNYNCSSTWPFLVINFIGVVLSSILMMPIFIYNIRIVKDQLKSMAVGIFHLSMSLFASIPGPVIGGKIVDQACLLWSDHVNNSGSCSFYDIHALRYNLSGMGIASRSVSIVVISSILCFTWNMAKWPNARDEEAEEDPELATDRKSKPGALLMKSTNREKT